MRHHLLSAQPTVHRWNRAYAPRLWVDSGDRLTIELEDSSGRQVQPDWTADDLRARLDPTRIHALTGPIGIHGAEPGDVLEVRFEEVRHQGWAWTALLPGLGLLPERFPRHHLFIWKLERDHTTSLPGTRVDLAPFCGIVGVQRAAEGEFRTRAPGAFGGNLDVRQMTAGSQLYVPVEVPGAGLCLGDAHAAQGDGEVCINGLEAPMEVTVQVQLHRSRGLAGPLLVAAGPLVPPRYLTRPWLAFIESDEQPRAAAARAVSRAVDHLADRLSISPELAYTLCSAVLDLRLSQVVNVPMTTVSALVPEAVLLQPGAWPPA